MKTILFITAHSMSIHDAGVNYTNQLLNELAKTCTIDVVCFHYKNASAVDTPKNVKIVLDTEISTWFKVKGLLMSFGTFPLFAARYNNKVLSYIRHRLEEVKYDFVYFDFSQTFTYAKAIDHPHKILMSHDVIAQKYERMHTYMRPWALRSERHLLSKGQVFTFSEKDCNILKKLYGIESFHTTFFINPYVRNAFPTKVESYFVFFGSWGREENFESLEWYLENVEPIMGENIHYKVIGGSMPERVIRKLRDRTNYEFMGFVDNPYPIIANAIAELAPLQKGAGVKVKCIEALGCGTPIIGSKIAMEGIPLEYGDFLITAETPEQYKQAMKSLSKDTNERTSFKKNFLKSYDDKAIIRYINNGNVK